MKSKFTDSLAPPKRARHLSSLLATLSAGVLLALWGGFAALIISEYKESLEDAKEELRTVAEAYVDYLAAASLVTPIDSAALEHQQEDLDAFRAALRVAPDAVLTVSSMPGDPSQRVAVNDRSDEMTLRIQASRSAEHLVVTASHSAWNALASWRYGALVEGGGLLLLSILLGACGMLLVVHMRRREVVEADLIRATQEAQAGNRAKSDFLANMSHEIRTPMNGVLGMTELLLATELDAEQRGFAELVRESGETLLAIVNDILDVSKLEAGKFELEHIDFDLMSVVENAVALMAGRAREKLLDLAVFVEPQARGAYRGDPVRVRQVLLNLLSNAVKFTEAGGVGVKVTVTLGNLDAAGRIPLRFEVTDTGMGMPESMRERLFQKFSQADSSVARRFGGTGLGLAIAKQLVELMGGTIGVSSRIGSGSTFWFEVPFERAKAMVIDRGQVPEHFKLLRALVVDDIAMNIDILGHQLRALGATVKGVDDGYGALAELERAWHSGRPYDLVFADHMMPGMSGDILVRRMRAQSYLCETKIVIVSSAGRHALLNRNELVLDAVLEKPLRQQDLLDCLINLYGSGGVSHPAPAADRELLTGPRATSPLRILLAEDNKINQKLAVAMLEKDGHQVTVVQNGHEAVDAVRVTHFDVVLMDVEMPLLGGMEATHQIRSLNGPVSQIRIVAMTAHAMKGAREKYLAAGMNDYMSKPVDIGTLRSKLAVVEPAMQAMLDTASRSPIEGNPSQVLDDDLLDQLAEDIGAPVVDDIIQEFLKQATLVLEDIAQHLERADPQGAAREAHKLVGNAGYLGLKRLSETARTLEQEGRSGGSEQIHRVSADLAAEGARASEALMGWRQARVVTTPESPLQTGTGGLGR